MSRQRIPMQDGTLLIIGWDPPFQTWYALHYDDSNDNKSPRVAIGYHPAEQNILRSERPDAVIGPYPITDDDLENMLTRLIPELMGIHGTDDQPDCWSCHQPPWRPNPDCRSHPFNQLKGS